MKENKYKIIDLLRIRLDEPWAIFGPRVGAEMGVPWSTLYKVVTGKTKPYARTSFKIDTWIEAHKDELEAVHAA